MYMKPKLDVRINTERQKKKKISQKNTHKKKIR